jgi:hypothetical protein
MRRKKQRGGGDPTKAQKAFMALSEREKVRVLMDELTEAQEELKMMTVEKDNAMAIGERYAEEAAEGGLAVTAPRGARMAGMTVNTRFQDLVLTVEVPEGVPEDTGEFVLSCKMVNDTLYAQLKDADRVLKERLDQQHAEIMEGVKDSLKKTADTHTEQLDMKDAELRSALEAVDAKYNAQTTDLEHEISLRRAAQDETRAATTKNLELLSKAATKREEEREMERKKEEEGRRAFHAKHFDETQRQLEEQAQELSQRYLAALVEQDTKIQACLEEAAGAVPAMNQITQLLEK